MAKATIIKIGNKYGQLTVTEDLGKGTCRWVCRCACGAVKTYQAYWLTNGRVKSCGCQNPNTRFGEARRKHGKKGTPEYRAWRAMICRCTLPSSVGYHRYGGRGVRVCDKWTGDNGFSHFLSDVGHKPTPRHTLDRIDNEGHYEPGNVRWSTRKEQARNTRRNRFITAFGKTQTVAAWSEETGINYTTIMQRLNRGWNEQRALRK